MTTNSKKPHPADQIDTAAIASARQFTATLFRGVGKFDKAEAPSLPAIRAKAAEMEKAAKNGKRAMIHAVVNGKAIPVPASFMLPLSVPAKAKGKARPRRRSATDRKPKR